MSDGDLDVDELELERERELLAELLDRDAERGSDPIERTSDELPIARGQRARRCARCYAVADHRLTTTKRDGRIGRQRSPLW